MLWERGSIGIPSYVIMNNPNQEKICTELNKAGLLVLGHYDQNNDLAKEIEKIQSLFNDREKLDMISQKLRSTICA